MIHQDYCKAFKFISEKEKKQSETIGHDLTNKKQFVFLKDQIRKIEMERYFLGYSSDLMWSNDGCHLTQTESGERKEKKKDKITGKLGLINSVFP